MNSSKQEESHTSAMVIPSLFCIQSGAEELMERKEIWEEALLWQQKSQDGGLDEFAGMLRGGQKREKEYRRPFPNRLIEIDGLMGAIGEQLSLAWSAEQDTQRMRFYSEHKFLIQKRMSQRALAELSGYFILGAAHSLANLCLRVILLNEDSASYINSKHKEANGFPPGSDDRKTWISFNKDHVKEMKRASEKSNNESFKQMVVVLETFLKDVSFRSLEVRRGMDFHRRRPQSVPHISPRKGAISTEDGIIKKFEMPNPELEPEADADAIHDIVIKTLKSLSEAMKEIRLSIPTAIEKEGIYYTTNTSRIVVV